jgi:hypothetical protein
MDKSIVKKQEQAALIWGYQLIDDSGVEDKLGWYRLWNAFYSELLKETNEEQKRRD